MEYGLVGLNDDEDTVKPTLIIDHGDYILQMMGNAEDRNTYLSIETIDHRILVDLDLEYLDEVIDKFGEFIDAIERNRNDGD